MGVGVGYKHQLSQWPTHSNNASLPLPLSSIHFPASLWSVSQLRFFSWVNIARLKLFMDSYHTPYKAKHYYWPELLLVLRFVPLLVFAFVPKEGPSVNLLGILVRTCMEDRCLGSRALLRPVPRRIAAKGIEPPYCYSVSAGLMNCLVVWAWVMQWCVYRD